MGSLVKEAKQLESLLSGKIVRRVACHRPTELLLEFTDGTRLFVDRTDEGLELSVTGGGDGPS